jgi:N-succinyldiaminopimelate aminotransferase
MNPFLQTLHPYPFQRLGRLLADINTDASRHPIPLSVGEPKHTAPEFIVNLLSETAQIEKSLGTYPATRGIPDLRQAISQWANNRYQLSTAPLDPDKNVLPVSGTREALFSFAQALINAWDTKPQVLIPNPFYQIYEGACLLSGAEPVFLNCNEDNAYLPDFRSITDDIWQKCQLLYLCSPGNPTGAVLDSDTLIFLIEKAQEHEFVIASDECYSEIYYDESNPPTGLLQACCQAGLKNYTRCITFNSLSKRSNLPGLRSGFVAGDAEIIDQYLLYRTYHGAAMPLIHQIASTHAWQDEKHVIENRKIYRQKFDRVYSLLAESLPVTLPEAGFYLWPGTPGSDEDFTRELYRSQNVTVLPGTYLSRESNGINPGQQRVRMALVAPLEDCIEAAERVIDYLARSG